MTRNELGAKGRKIALDDMEVGPTDAAGVDLEQNGALCQGWTRNVFDPDKGLGVLMRRGE